MVKATIEDAEFAYAADGFCLRIPSLELDAGAKTAFVGPSGSGKTTLLNLLAGVRVPDRGRVEVGGVNLGALSDAERRAFRIRRVGFVFQDFELIEYLNVRENVLLPYRLNPALRLDGAVRSAADELVESMGLGDKLRRRVDQLSQGEKQRVAICRALAPQPELILADEPTGNLDPDNKRRILDLLFDRAGSSGATLAVVTHDHSLLDGFEQVVDFEQFRGRQA